jgi:glucosylceramidase
MITFQQHIFLQSFLILFSIGLFGQNSVARAFDSDISKKNIKLYTTAKDTDLRLTRVEDHFFSNLVQPLETEIAIFINPKKTFQKFLGIGGAITDASSEVFSKISEKKPREITWSLLQ